MLKFNNFINKLYNVLLFILIIFSSSINAEDTNINQLNCYYQASTIAEQQVHILTVNPRKHTIINASATTINKNVAHVGQIARKFKAVAAINGGFFREIDNNKFVPAGILKNDNIWHGIAYKTRAALGWKKNGTLTLIDRLSTQTSVEINKIKFPINHFNPPNYSSKTIHHKLILYSSIYPDFYSFNLTDVTQQNFTIKEQNTINYIYNFNNNPQFINLSINELNSAKLIVDLKPQIDPSSLELWNSVDFITNGSPVLIKNHRILSDYYKEKISTNFTELRHARSAVCILDNGFWKLIKTQNSTIPELTNIMAILQCKEAINLDGGSSSDLYLSEIFNNKQELTSIVSPVTDAILVLPFITI